MLSSNQKNVLNNVAVKLNINPDWLYDLINFESGFNPKIKNKLSTARGLLQFIDTTARKLGYLDSNDLILQNDTIEKQLTGPVYNYLSWYKPYSTRQSLYMAVFFPPARQWPLNAAFPPEIVRVNPGIYTVRDYMRLVDKNKNKTVPYLIGIILAVLYFLTNKKRA